MRLVQLGDNRLGQRIRRILAAGPDEILGAHTRDDLHVALENGPVDWLVSAGCRFVLRASELDAVQDNCNLHTSFLPWGRGANPNVWAIAHREPAGATLHRMVPEVDAGPIFAQRSVPIVFGDTADTCYQKLEDAAVELFAEVWPRVRDGSLVPNEAAPGGSTHRVADARALADIDLDDVVTWRQALDTLRALTFPPHRNLVVEEGGRRWHVEIRISEIP